MAKQCITEKAIAKQIAICFALEEMLMERDYEEIFVSDLCARAGISRRSFYRYFAGKDDVLLAILENIVQDCNMNAVNVFYPEQKLEDQLMKFFCYWQEKRSHWLVIISRNHLEALVVERFVDWILREFLRDKSIEDQTREVILDSLEFTVTGLLANLFRWGQSGFRKTPQEMTAHMIRVMTRPLYDNIWQKSAQL